MLFTGDTWQHIMTLCCIFRAGIKHLNFCYKPEIKRIDVILLKKSINILHDSLTIKSKLKSKKHLINCCTSQIKIVMVGNYLAWSTMLSSISKDRSPNELFILVSILYYFQYLYRLFIIVKHTRVMWVKKRLTWLRNCVFCISFFESFFSRVFRWACCFWVFLRITNFFFGSLVIPLYFHYLRVTICCHV